MTNDDYDLVVSQSMLLARLSRKLDVAGALERLSRADDVAVFLNPTLWRAASPKVEIIKRVLEGVLALQRKLPNEEECLQADAESDALRKISGI